jgi:hypothetical protein
MRMSWGSIYFTYEHRNYYRRWTYDCNEHCHDSNIHVRPKICTILSKKAFPFPERLFKFKFLDYMCIGLLSVAARAASFMASAYVGCA